MCKKGAKMANVWTYVLNYWERTVEDPGNIYRDCPRGVPMGGQNVP